jgi:hypothetical protein
MEMPKAALPAHDFVHGPILPGILGRPPRSLGLDFADGIASWQDGASEPPPPWLERRGRNVFDADQVDQRLIGLRLMHVFVRDAAGSWHVAMLGHGVRTG